VCLQCAGQGFPVEWFIKYVLGEWSVIKTAPLAFATAVTAVVIGTMTLFSWGYGREVSYLNVQLADYKEKLKGDSPEQAKARIDILERAVVQTIGYPWRPLTQGEIAALAAALKRSSHRKFLLLRVNYNGKALANTLYDAFAAAGWVGVLSQISPVDTDYGLQLSGPRAVTLEVKAMIEENTGLRIRIVDAFERSSGDPAVSDTPVMLVVSVNTDKP
jgi:hypothetical protein